MPERSKGVVSSTTIFGFVGSNPTLCICPCGLMDKACDF